MSQRPTEEPVAPDRPVLDDADSALLDAARTCIMAVGVKRTTLTDVARRAGVSRMTVYRRFPDVAALVQSLMTREFLALIHESRDEVAGDHPTSRERFAAAVADGAYRLSEHELFQRILDVDPDLLMTYAFHRYGTFQKAALATFTEQLRAGIADGSIRDADPALLAATTEIMFRGFVFAARAEGVTENREALRDELHATLERGLRP